MTYWPPEGSWPDVSGSDPDIPPDATVAQLRAHIAADHAAMDGYLAEHERALAALDSAASWKAHAQIDCAALRRCWHLAQRWQQGGWAAEAAGELVSAITGEGWKETLP